MTIRAEDGDRSGVSPAQFELGEAGRAPVEDDAPEGPGGEVARVEARSGEELLRRCVDAWLDQLVRDLVAEQELARLPGRRAATDAHDEE
jgi:creatinine amidohydrolase/Fe(II)-dependent formamide hydrolase-like protein